MQGCSNCKKRGLVRWNRRQGKKRKLKYGKIRSEMNKYTFQYKGYRNVTFYFLAKRPKVIRDNKGK